MKKWPGNDDFGSDNVPWNVMSWDTYHKALADRGSLPTALSAGMLTNLGDEDNTTLMSVMDDNGPATPYSERDKAYTECDMSSILGLYGAVVFLGSSYKYSYRTGANRWHRVRRTTGLYKNNAGGNQSNVQLTPFSSLVDNDLSTPIVENVNDSGVNIGVQVGTENMGDTFGNAVDCLLVVTDIALSNFSIYKSDDNRVWIPVTKSTFTDGYGWSQGEKAVANLRGSGVNGRMIMLSQPEQANYFKIVSNSTPSAPYDLYECYALNLQGELRYSNDLDNWNGAVRDTTYTDFLLFKFLELRNEVRAVEYMVDPFDPTSAMAARIDLDHVEMYADTAAVDFGTDGSLRTITITDGELGAVGDAQTVVVKNADTYSRTAKKAYAHMPMGRRIVTAQALTAAGTTEQLEDTVRRVSYCRYILDVAYTALGTFGDSSVVMGGTMAAWVEVAWGGAPAGNQYAINYNTGAIETGNVIPAGATVTFSYANPGAGSIQISADNITWVGPGYANRITLENTDIGPGETASFWARANLTYFTDSSEDVIRTALSIIEMSFSGSKS